MLVAGHDGAIPWTAIDAYARRYRISSIDRFEEFLAQVRAVEDVWRDVVKRPESK